MNLRSGSRKEIFLCAGFLLLHILMLLMWYRVVPVIVQGDFAHYRIFASPVLMLVFAASLFSLAALLVKHKMLLAGTAVAAGIFPFFFGVSFSGIPGAAIVIALLILMLAVSTIRKEAAGSLHYRIPRFLKQGLGFYFTAVALAVSLFYLNGVDGQKAYSILFPQSLFDFTLRTFSGTIQNATGLPPIRPEQTVNDVMTVLIKMQLQSRGVPFDKIPKQELVRLLEFQRNEFAKSYGIGLGGSERIGTIFANTVTSKVKDLLGKYNRYLPLAAAVGFFFAFKAISIIFRWASIALAMLLMKLLILVKLVKKQKEQIEVERIVL